MAAPVRSASTASASAANAVPEEGHGKTRPFGTLIDQHGHESAGPQVPKRGGDGPAFREHVLPIEIAQRVRRSLSSGFSSGPATATDGTPWQQRWPLQQLPVTEVPGEADEAASTRQRGAQVFDTLHLDVPAVRVGANRRNAAVSTITRPKCRIASLTRRRAPRGVNSPPYASSTLRRAARRWRTSSAQKA